MSLLENCIFLALHASALTGGWHCGKLFRGGMTADKTNRCKNIATAAGAVAVLTLSVLLYLLKQPQGG